MNELERNAYEEGHLDSQYSAEKALLSRALAEVPLDPEELERQWRRFAQEIDKPSIGRSRRWGRITVAAALLVCAVVLGVCGLRRFHNGPRDSAKSKGGPAISTHHSDQTASKNPSKRDFAAVLFVVDKSGSMAGEAINDVKAACLAGANELRPDDFAGVLAFDARPRWISLLTKRNEGNSLELAVEKLLPDGSTRIHPALVEALKGFESNIDVRAATRKHIILLSDGNTPPDDLEGVVKRLAQEGVSVSTVCLGIGTFDAPVMSQIATWGGGRFKFTNRSGDLPKVFVDEVRQILGRKP